MIRRLEGLVLCLEEDCGHTWHWSESNVSRCPVCGSGATVPVASCIYRGEENHGTVANH